MESQIVSNQSQSLFNWERLNNWAKTKQHEETVGYCCTCNMCPVAEYLKEATGEQWIVFAAGISRNAQGGVELLPRPAWIKRLVRNIDATSRDGQPGIITREHFLDLLSQVRPRTSTDIATKEVRS